MLIHSLSFPWGAPSSATLSPQRFSQQRKRHGFTLVEMMVTIAILVIALGIAVPPMTDWVNRSQLNAASQSLQSALRASQSQAQSQSRVIALILTNTVMTDDNLQASQITGNLTHWATYAIPIDGSSDEARLLQTGTLHSTDKITATLTDGQAICFNSLGRLSHQELKKPFAIDCAGTAMLTLKHSSMADKPATLAVNAGGKTTLKH